jgi:NAD(P)-dependent dehydrogenase (short-subunit alcohol dehydrogenase family)
MPDMAGRVCLITGATNGIGRAAANALAALGAELILHGRDAIRLKSSMEEIRAASGNSSVSFVVADLASLADVRRMAAEVNASPRPLHVLINNAGVLSLTAKTTRDGHELMFGVNHLAHFLLTNLLLGKLKASAPARVVVVASRAHVGNPVDLSRLAPEPGLGNLSAYGRSKFANVLFAKELARRLSGTRVIANALHPGVVMTNMVRGRTPPISWIVPLLRPFLVTPEDGAKTTIYLASAPEVEGVTGKYFVQCREAAADARTDDAALARALWDKSAELVGPT